MSNLYICIYIYIYIYCHPQTDCFVVSQLFSVARRVGRLKLGSKPAQRYVRLYITPLSQKAYPIGKGIIRYYVATAAAVFVCLPTESTWVGICLPVILDRTLLSTCEYTPIRSRRKRRASDCLPFFTGCNREGRDVCHFSLATFSLKFNSCSILIFSGVCCAV